MAETVQKRQRQLKFAIICQFHCSTPTFYAQIHLIEVSTPLLSILHGLNHTFHQVSSLIKAELPETAKIPKGDGGDESEMAETGQKMAETVQKWRRWLKFAIIGSFHCSISTFYAEFHLLEASSPSSPIYMGSTIFFIKFPL